VHKRTYLKHFQSILRRVLINAKPPDMCHGISISQAPACRGRPSLYGGLTMPEYVAAEKLGPPPSLRDASTPQSACMVCVQQEQRR
jgi:hypothetical protein